MSQRWPSLRRTWTAGAICVLLAGGGASTVGTARGSAGSGRRSLPAGHVPAWVARYTFKSGRDASGVAVAVSPDGKTVYVLAGSDRSVMLGGDRVAHYVTAAYEASTGAKIWVAPYLTSKGSYSAYGIAVSPDGTRIYVTGDDGAGDAATVAYRATNGAEVWVARSDQMSVVGHGSSAAGSVGVSSGVIAVSPDGAKIFILGYGSKASGAPLVVLAYTAKNGAQAWAARYRAAGRDGVAPWALTPSPDGKTVYIAAAGSNDTASWDLTLAYNAATGARLWRALCKRGNGPSGLAVSPNGSRVYVTGDGFGASALGVTVAYDAATGSQVWLARYRDPRHQSYRDSPEGVAVSPDGTRVYVSGQNGSGSGNVTVAYSTRTGAQLWLADNRNGVAVSALAVSSDGKKVFVVGTRLPNDSFGLTLAYDAATGRQLWSSRYTGPAHGNALLNAIAPSPDGSKLYVTGAARVSAKGYVCVTMAYRAG